MMQDKENFLNSLHNSMDSILSKIESSKSLSEIQEAESLYIQFQDSMRKFEDLIPESKKKTLSFRVYKKRAYYMRSKISQEMKLKEKKIQKKEELQEKQLKNSQNLLNKSTPKLSNNSLQAARILARMIIEEAVKLQEEKNKISSPSINPNLSLNYSCSYVDMKNVYNSIKDSNKEDDLEEVDFLKGMDEVL